MKSLGNISANVQGKSANKTIDHTCYDEFIRERKGNMLPKNKSFWKPEDLKKQRYEQEMQDNDPDL